MIDAVDAVPVVQQIAYEVAAPAILGAHGRALDGSGSRSAERITDNARIHCVVSAAGGEMAVCDNATLISLGSHAAHPPSARPPAAQARPAILSASETPVTVATAAGTDFAPPSVNADEPTRRWLADLLMTFGIGMLLVASFLFMTSRDPLPVRRRA
jgi:hypothetical protein